MVVVSLLIIRFELDRDGAVHGEGAGDGGEFVTITIVIITTITIEIIIGAAVALGGGNTNDVHPIKAFFFAMIFLGEHKTVKGECDSFSSG